jgi:hypothetical protein
MTKTQRTPQRKLTNPYRPTAQPEFRSVRKRVKNPPCRARRQRLIFHWVQDRPDGRAYLWKFLVRLASPGDSELAAVAGAKPSNPGTLCLYKQLKLIFPYVPVKRSHVRQVWLTRNKPHDQRVWLSKDRPHAQRVRLLTKLLLNFESIAASDPDAPKWLSERLRDYRRRNNSNTAPMFGESDGRRCWPDNNYLQQVFRACARHLSISDLFDYPKTPIECRPVARALANFVTGRKDNFEKAPKALQDLVRNTCSAGPLKSWLEVLARARLSGDKSEDTPIKRLATVLERQFRAWRLARFPKPKYVALEMLATASPWVQDSLPRQKDKASRADDILRKQFGPKQTTSNTQRYTRAGARK